MVGANQVRSEGFVVSISRSSYTIGVAVASSQQVSRERQ